MKAIVQEKYGSTDALEVRDVPRPDIAGDEVLVRVLAAGVDRGVWHLMTGLPYAVRLAGYGLRAPKRQVPGMDLAGIVESTGAAVTRFAAGDEVFGTGHGAFAEYAVAREADLAKKPAAVSFEQAAAAPTSGLAALQALRYHGRVGPGQQVLITGASGGVGTFAVQLARAIGAHVTAVCSAGKADLVRSLGAERVVDYAREDFADGDRRYDVIVDIGGNASLARLRQALEPHGILVIIGGETGGRWLGGADRQVRARLLSLFVGQTLTTFISRSTTRDLMTLARFMEEGEVVPVVDATFPLTDAPQAISYLEEGHAKGKVVIAA